MRSVPNDIKMLISKYSNMNIEELNAYIKNWEVKSDCANQLKILEIAKNELDLKYREREEQIKLLTQSLTSSSRAGRWISSIRLILKQFLYFRFRSHRSDW